MTGMASTIIAIGCEACPEAQGYHQPSQAAIRVVPPTAITFQSFAASNAKHVAIATV